MLALFFNIFVNPIALGNFGWKYYIVFVALLIIISLTAWFFCPETKVTLWRKWPSFPTAIEQRFQKSPTPHARLQQPQELAKTGLEMAHIEILHMPSHGW
ncbi:uncharacterized protein PV06_06971 [Exophiala oligosperma]|uniref:Major facilitator superfamily (MFS) profile domain-containing protein n=2 Tax=Chaetothyriales TaxID=34395 RepID=A0A0D2E0S9_9EURO|nr:uncharacterized protein PV06_06971 [Exophiala oligosperma]KAJ9640793.1 hypothetical protein H2204_003082 [Knufia peltigerae]KIW41409.1 hypothetical protein PV06_06971 [Exophiala oligosperma]